MNCPTCARLRREDDLENARAVVEAARGFVIAKTDVKPGSKLWFDMLVRAIAKYDEGTQ